MSDYSIMQLLTIINQFIKMYYYTIAIFASLLFLFSACGEEEVQPLEEAEVDDVQIVRISSVGDEMRFDKSEIRVKANQPVRIILENEATMNVMMHNILIVNEGTVNEVGQAALNAGDNDYVPDNPNVLFASDLAGPGETVEFEFMPPEPGTYEFACTYPGHYSTMRGAFIVEEE